MYTGTTEKIYGWMIYTKGNSPAFYTHDLGQETNVLHDSLNPAIKALGLRQAGMHAFRYNCTRRWELAGMNPAVLHQQLGHSTAAMTARYTGEIPIEEVRAAFSTNNGPKIVVLENGKLLENSESIRDVA
jgi:integrase